MLAVGHPSNEKTIGELIIIEVGYFLTCLMYHIDHIWSGPGRSSDCRHSAVQRKWGISEAVQRKKGAASQSV